MKLFYYIPIFALHKENGGDLKQSCTVIRTWFHLQSLLIVLKNLIPALGRFFRCDSEMKVILERRRRY